MADPLNQEHCDELLQPLLAVSNEADEDRILTALIQKHATPIIKGVIRLKVAGWANSPDCYEDIQAEVIVRLLTRLRQFKQNPVDYSIWNFRDYVAASTGRICNNYLRAQYPNRCRLKNSIMYLLTRDPSFFLEEESGKRICGLSEWKKSNHPMELLEVLPDPVDIRVKLPTTYQDAATLRHALKELFHFSRNPIQLEGILTIMVNIFSVQDHRQKSELDNRNIFDIIPDVSSDPTKKIETIQYLKRMWDEICLLPVKQRAALLLNLKDPDGKDLLSLFPINGIATFRKIATILEIAPDQFAEIWKEVPLGDTKIGELIGATRQQVINLRKSARERLIRRSRED